MKAIMYLILLFSGSHLSLLAGLAIVGVVGSWFLIGVLVLLNGGIPTIDDVRVK